MKKLLTLVSCTALLFACGSEEEAQTLTMQVSLDEFNIIIPAKGELKSASEIAINAPNAVRSNLTLSWLKEENSVVKEGDVIAIFDGEQHLLQRQQADLEFQKIELSKGNTEQTLALDQFSIAQQSRIIQEEIAITDRFATEDLSIYSKNEVIEQLLNKEFLSAKDGYLTWSKESKTEQGTAQIQLLALQGKSHADTINMHSAILTQLEVKAPQDGILIHSKNWRGEKVREGSSLWPGSKIASIPSLDKMQAKIYVLEIEAAGIKIDLPVELALDAYPDKKVTGKVSSMASIAAPRQQRNPVKYFEVTVDIDNSEPEFMKPGQKVTANIIVHRQSEAISVPNQVIFQKDGQNWVYVKRDGEFEKQPVTVGMRSLTKSQLTSGVEAGDDIALVEPKLEGKS